MNLYDVKCQFSRATMMKMYTCPNCEKRLEQVECEKLKKANEALEILIANSFK